MKKLTFALLLAALGSGGALAADPVGVAQTVQGIVTVSQGNTMGNLVKDLKIFDGMRLAAASTGSALIKLNNGCEISLAANESILIDAALDCKALVASITKPPAGGGLAGGGGGGAFAGGGFGGGLPIALGVGYGASVRHWTKRPNSSGS